MNQLCLTWKWFFFWQTNESSTVEKLKPLSASTWNPICCLHGSKGGKPLCNFILTLVHSIIIYFPTHYTIYNKYLDHLPKVHKDVMWEKSRLSKCNHFIFNPAQLTCPAVLHHTPHATSSPCGPAISVAEAGHSHHQNPAPVTRLHPRETSSPGSGDTH